MPPSPPKIASPEREGTIAQHEQPLLESTTLTRRRVLAGIGTVAAGSLAGCGLLGSPPEVVVFNRGDSEITVAVSVRGSDGEELLSEETTIEADGAFEADDVLPSEGTVTLAVEVEDGPSDSEDFEVTDDTRSIQARVDSDIEFDSV